MMKSWIFLLLPAISIIALSQERPSLDEVGVESHGTCAITATAPFGIAFIIDSRITFEDTKGSFVKHEERCKVRLARPTIILAGVALVTRDGTAGKWNSLDAAAIALKSLPDNPTVADLDSWSAAWANTLIQHFRGGRETPREPTDDLADMLLLTQVDGQPYYRRTYVRWDGIQFFKDIEGQDIDKTIPQVHYAGYCRRFASVDDGHGGHIPIREQRSWAEGIRFNKAGNRKINAKSADDLATAVYGLESVSTDMDQRLEGDKAVIAPPFATAEWAKGDKGWTTDFNAACTPSISSAHSTRRTNPNSTRQNVR